MRNAVVITFALAVASCFSSVIERQCEKDADCGSGWRCIATICVDIGAGTGGSGNTGVGGGSTTGVGGGTAVGGGVGGGGGNPLCNPNNCLNGCCAGNVCIPTTAQNAVNCGKAGAACLSCNPGGLCKDGACFGGTCDSTTCTTGCCLSNQCVPTSLQNQFACGTGGGICQSCGSTNSCTNGTCIATPCGAQTCPSGCCFQNTCVPSAGQSNALCGTGGKVCASCASNQSCTNGACGMSVCNASTCSGCCSGNLCIPLGAQSSTTCGRNGQACATCPMGNVCNGSGMCTATGCGPTTCRGCCSAGGCANGTDNFACGQNGVVCQGCASGFTCVNGSCLGCGPQTCSGCCQFGFCQAGNLVNACGFGGQTCVGCVAGTNCVGQRCTGVIDAGMPPGPDAGRLTGAACNNASECQPPATAFCVPQNLSMINTGYIGGYCTRDCSATVSCPAGAVCITENIGGTINTTCKALCSNPGGGQSTCRSNYICIPSPSGVGWCGPRCGNQSFPCPSGGTCNFSTGYCT